MYTVFSFLSYAALVCVLVALWNPRIYPLKKPTRVKAAGFYLAAFIVFFILSAPSDSGDTKHGVLTLQEEKESAEAATMSAAPLTLLQKETISMPKNGRNRLHVRLCMGEEQAGATQKDLTAIAAKAAEQYQKESGEPVLLLDLVCQKADNPLGETQLAQVVYIPDGKGFDGASTAASPWETFRVAKRGFSAPEREYLQVWAKYYRNYQSALGLQEKELDDAVCKELGIEPGSLRPFANGLEAVQAP